jgi:iron complex transport system substrate-binding protein
MRIMGARWLAAKLHPGRYTFDERGETKRFYTLFFGVTPGDADLDLLFSQ